MSNSTQKSKYDMEKYTYRELQKMAKTMSLPANLKKEYLIKVILLKQFGSPTALSEIIDKAKRERSSFQIKEEQIDTEDFAVAIFSPTVSSTEENRTESCTTLRHQRYKLRDKLKRAYNKEHTIKRNKRMRKIRQRSKVVTDINTFIYHSTTYVPGPQAEIRLCLPQDSQETDNQKFTMDVKQSDTSEYFHSPQTVTSSTSQKRIKFVEYQLRNDMWMGRINIQLPRISDAFSNIVCYDSMWSDEVVNETDLNIIEPQQIGDYIIDLNLAIDNDIVPLAQEDFLEDQSYVNNTLDEQIFFGEVEVPSNLMEIECNTINELVPHFGLMNLMEDALQVVDDDTKYVEMLGLDETTWCTDCHWTGRRLYLELHLRKDHFDRVYQSEDLSWTVSFNVGVLMRHGRLVELLQDCHGALYVLCATYTGPGGVSVAILSVTPDENVTVAASITAYSNVTANDNVTLQAFSWRGSVDRLPSNYPNESFTNGLRVTMDDVNMLLNNMHSVFRETIDKLSSDDIHINLFVEVVSD